MLYIYFLKRLRIKFICSMLKLIIQCTKIFSHFHSAFSHHQKIGGKERKNMCTRESKPSTILLFSNSLVASSSSAPHGVSNLRKCFPLKFSTHAPILSHSSPYFRKIFSFRYAEGEKERCVSYPSSEWLGPP